MKTKSTVAALTACLPLAAVLGLLLIPRTGLSTSISCGQTLTGTISAAGQTDPYTFSGTAGEAVVFTVKTASGTLSAVAEIYDPSGTSHSGYSSGASLTLPATGTYTILVHDSSYSATGSYGLGLSFSTGRCGTPIACGQTLSNNISAVAQYFSYTFSGTAGEAVVFALKTTSGTLNAAAQLYDPMGSELYGGPTDGTGSITLPSTGTYTILVHDYNHSATGSYGLGLSFSTGRCGTPIDCGQTLSNNISAVAQYIPYTFSGTAGEAVVFAVQTASGTLESVAELYDPTGNMIGSAWSKHTASSGSVTLPSTGTYTILVHDYNYSATGSYGLGLSFSTGRCGTPIACGQTLSNNISAVAQSIPYTFSGTAGEVVVFAVQTTLPGFFVFAQLYGPAGGELGSAIMGDSGRIKLPSTGTYTILVNDFDSYRNTGSYGVSLTVIGGCVSLPTVTVTPASLMVAAGSPATFTANASGPTPLFYQWWFSTNRLYRATNSTYNIATVQTTNVGSYAVVVSNPGGAVTSTPPAQLSIGSVLSAVPNTNILETVLWQYTPTVSGSGYTFGLSNAPTEMTVNSSSGLIAWTPTEAQGPSTNANIAYIAYQSGATVARTNFTVVVLESNRPPAFLNTPGTQTVYATTTLNVSDGATDPDLPANTLTYAIVSGPSGVGINSSSGLLSWTPTSGQVGTNTIYVSVTDYNPWAVNSQHLSVTNSFQVQVLKLTPPTLTITIPTSGQRWSNAVFTVIGTATDNVAVASVNYNLNNTGWSNAVTLNSFTNWTATVMLIPGTNTVAAYATDNTGNNSATNSVNFQYVVTNQLQMSMTGLGTISPNYSNAWLEVGRNYSVTSAPAAGFRFTNWTSSQGWSSNAAALTFMMASNLTFTANFIDTNKPVLSITNLVAGQRWSNTVFTVRGTATDNWQVANVQYQFNSLNWSNATTTNAWTNWFATLNLLPGTNAVAAYATDNSGNLSTTNSVYFQYVVTNQLLIRTNGKGTIFPTNYSNGWLEIGRNYSITSAPATGFVFTNWTVSTNWIGGVTVTGTNLLFMMQSNLTLLATFNETSRPTLLITAPTNNQHMTNALANIIGTNSDNWGVSGVWYRLNSNAWHSVATTTNSYTNWTQMVTLLSGNNTVNAYAINLGGNYSLTNSVSFVSSNTFALQLIFTNAQPMKTNGLAFNLQLSTGLSGHIQVSTNLASLTNWVTLTNFVGTNATITFRDPGATNSGPRFYRAVIP